MLILMAERSRYQDTPDFGDAVISYGSTPYKKEEARNLFPIFYSIFMKCGDFRRTGSQNLTCVMLPAEESMDILNVT